MSETKAEQRLRQLSAECIETAASIIDPISVSEEFSADAYVLDLGREAIALWRELLEPDVDMTYDPVRIQERARTVLGRAS